MPVKSEDEGVWLALHDPEQIAHLDHGKLYEAEAVDRDLGRMKLRRADARLPTGRLRALAEYVESMGLASVSEELREIAHEAEDNDQIRELAIAEYRAYHDQAKAADRHGRDSAPARAAKAKWSETSSDLVEEISRVVDGE